MRSPPQNRFPRTGNAIVTVLLVIVLMSGILVVCITNVKVTRQVARSRMDTFLAEQFSTLGSEQAVGLLRYATDSSRNAYWVSRPGEITRFTPDSQASEVIPISSGSSSGIDGANLNRVLLEDPARGAVTGNSAEVMMLEWIYVRKDGTFDKSNSYNSSNPIIGRYAFWGDDDSTKFNINTAWTQRAVNTAPAGDPSRIELSSAIPGLTDAEVDKIDDFRKQHGSFNTVPDLLRALPDASDDLLTSLREAQFRLTHYNATPELTYFGAPKIVLTTQQRRATLPDGTVLPFLDIYDHPDWGGATPSGNINQEKVAATVATLVSYLSRNDWPMAPGKTFQDKFYGGNQNSLKQLALNIIEYVRLKETPPWTPSSGLHRSAVVRLEVSAQANFQLPTNH